MGEKREEREGGFQDNNFLIYILSLTKRKSVAQPRLRERERRAEMRLREEERENKSKREEDNVLTSQTRDLCSNPK